MDEIQFNNNSFSFLRYLAAFQVLYGHIITHLQIHNYLPFLKFFSGVPIFFCLSGFLIANSLNKDNQKSSKYFKARFLRIYPELWIAVVLTALILFITNPILIKNLYFWLFNITQATFFQFWTPQALSYYGVGTPNGSLWTITIFVQFYILIFFLFPYIKKLNMKQHILILILSVIPCVSFVFIEPYIPTIIFKLFKQTIIPYWFMFYIGIVIYLFKDLLIPLLCKRFYMIFIIFILYCYFGNNIPSIYMDPIRLILLCLLTISFGYRFNTLKIKHDISFGIYLFHMIVINIFVENNILMHSFFGIIIVLLLSICLAILSNKLSSRIVHKIRII